MPVLEEISRRDLIEETLSALYRAAERPAQVVVGANALVSPTDNQLTLSMGTLAPSDRLEIGSEVMLVTSVSADAVPVYTVARGYLSTERASAPTGSVGLVNPAFHRHEVRRWVERGIDGLMNTELPYFETFVTQTVPGGGLIELPEDTIEVLGVRHFGLLDNRIAEVGGWKFEDALPSVVVHSGKALRVHSGVTPEDELMVTVRRPYLFSGDSESDTVKLPKVARDIPVLWASAYGQSRREVSRAELDKIEEWNQEQAIRAGVNLRMIRDMWGEVYRRVDEAKRVHRVPRSRVYRKMAKVW